MNSRLLLVLFVGLLAIALAAKEVPKEAPPAPAAGEQKDEGYWAKAKAWASQAATAASEKATEYAKITSDKAKEYVEKGKEYAAAGAAKAKEYFPAQGAAAPTPVETKKKDL